MWSSEDVNASVRHFFCSNRTYNDMATLLFNPQEAAIHQLFHQDGQWAPPQLEQQTVVMATERVCVPPQVPSVR